MGPGPGASPESRGGALFDANYLSSRDDVPAEYASPLAKRPYDLRHAAVSTWLNAGVAPTQVAEWAGHSVLVLLRVYAKCIYGQEEMATLRIEAALALPPTETNAKTSTDVEAEAATTATPATAGEARAAVTSSRIPHKQP